MDMLKKMIFGNRSFNNIYNYNPQRFKDDFVIATILNFNLLFGFITVLLNIEEIYLAVDSVILSLIFSILLLFLIAIITFVFLTLLWFFTFRCILPVLLSKKSYKNMIDKYNHLVLYIVGVERLSNVPLDAKDSIDIKNLKMNAPYYNNLVSGTLCSIEFYNLREYFNIEFDVVNHMKNINNFISERDIHSNLLATFYLQNSMKIEKAHNIIHLIEESVREIEHKHEEDYLGNEKLIIKYSNFISKSDFNKIFIELFDSLDKLTREYWKVIDDKELLEKVDNNMNEYLENIASIQEDAKKKIDAIKNL